MTAWARSATSTRTSRCPTAIPARRSNAICIHEEDDGILWKHSDHFSGLTEVRRSRRLVVSSVHTVGNYEYGIFWYLYLDGSIQLEMKLTGILNTSAIVEGADVPHGRRIGRQLAAPHHQHLFCVRLDLDIDGTDNTVVQIDSEALPAGPDNPFGSAFVARETPLRRESEGVADACIGHRPVLGGALGVEAQRAAASRPATG